jgi:hypothetical protein
MKNPILATMAITLVLLVACTGCMNTPQPALAPPLAPTTPAPAVTTAPVAMSTPEPLQTLPYRQQVDLQLTKDRTYSEIHLLYNGGGGEMFIRSVMMRVTRSDGQVIEQFMSDGKKPGRGDEIIVQGTRGSDRCEVYVTSAGTTYKVKDESLMVSGAYQGN